MAEMMRTIEWTGKRGARRLHIEAPGCIVNIVKGLRDSEGHEVTRVDIICDHYAGEPDWTMPDFPADDSRFLGVRIVRDLDKKSEAD